MPAFPLLAALPSGELPAWVGPALLLLPVLAGVLAGVLVVRRLAAATPLVAAGEAALVGPCAGLAVALLAYLSGGPLGSGRLTAVGPSPWQVGLAFAVEVAVPAAATAALLGRRRETARPQESR